MMTQLIPVKYLPVLFEGETNDEYTQETLQRLLNEEKQLKAHTENLKEAVTKTIEAYREYPEFIDADAQLQLALSELAILKEQQEMDSLNAGAGEDEMDFEHEDLPEEEPVAMEQPETTATKRALKALFKKLSLLCHPDRTRNPYLIELMPTIVQMYEASDYQGLVDLYESIKDVNSKVKSRREDARAHLINAINSAKLRVAQLQQEIEAIQSQGGFQLMMLRHMCSSMDAAVRNACSNMYQALHKVKMEINHMKSSRNGGYSFFTMHDFD